MARKMNYSGVEWIGEIPENWKVGRVKNCFAVVSGATPKSEKSEFWDGGIVWITPSDYVTTDKYIKYSHRSITQKGYDSCGTTIVPSGSIIFSKRAPIGTVAISDVELCTNQGCLSCVPYEKTDSEFYYYYMSIMQDQFELYGSGTTFKEISFKDFSCFPIPVLSYSEQKTISEYLKKKCASIDSIIDKTRASIKEYKKLRQAVITQAVTKGVRGDRTMKNSGVEWIGACPEDWAVHRIANLYDERSENGEADLPILQVSINTGISDHEIADEDLDRVFVRSEDRTKYKRVYPGDLAYNMMRAWQGAFGAVRV